MLKQQEPGPAEGLCASSPTGRSLPVTLAGPQQAHLSFQPVLLPSGNGPAWTGLLTGLCQCNYKQTWSPKIVTGTGDIP